MEHDRIHTRRDRRIVKKRIEILDAATRVFSEKGYANTTTKEIAQEADLGESTLYNYFESKHDILSAIMVENTLHMDDLIQDFTGLEDREALITMFERCLDLFTTRLSYTRTIFIEAWFDNDVLENYVVVRLNKVLKLIQNFIDLQIQAGVFKPCDSALVARMSIGMFYALILPFLRGKEPVPSPATRRTYSENMVSLLFDGIRTHPIQPKE